MERVPRKFDRTRIEAIDNEEDLIAALAPRYPWLSHSEHKSRIDTALHEAGHLFFGIRAMTQRAGHCGTYAFVRVPRGRAPAGQGDCLGATNPSGYTLENCALIRLGGIIVDLHRNRERTLANIMDDDFHGYDSDGSRFDRAVIDYAREQNMDPHEAGALLWNKADSEVFWNWSLICDLAVDLLLHADKKGLVTGARFDQLAEHYARRLS